MLFQKIKNKKKCINVKMDIQMLNFICEKFKHTFEWAIKKEWLKLGQMVSQKEVIYDFMLKVQIGLVRKIQWLKQ